MSRSFEDIVAFLEEHGDNIIKVNISPFFKIIRVRKVNQESDEVITSNSELHLPQLMQIISKFKNLEKLIIGEVHTDGTLSFPTGFFALRHLRFTSCNEEFTELPDEIGNLTNLETLFISSVMLTGFPDSIGKLTKLRVLEQMGNPLLYLPSSIGDLTQLERLDVNADAPYPDSFVNLKDTRVHSLSYEEWWPLYKRR